MRTFVVCHFREILVISQRCFLRNMAKRIRTIFARLCQFTSSCSSLCDCHLSTRALFISVFLAKSQKILWKVSFENLRRSSKRISRFTSSRRNVGQRLASRSRRLASGKSYAAEAPAPGRVSLHCLPSFCPSSAELRLQSAWKDPTQAKRWKKMSVTGVTVQRNLDLALEHG